jgi:hypothetical protein
MYTDMLNLCATYNGDVLKCRAAAMIYWRGLRAVGWYYFNQNQNFCTGGIDEPPQTEAGPEYYAPDCDSCPPDAICFRRIQVAAFDPNEKIGPEVYRRLELPLDYAVHFENVDSATASAQTVLITDSVDLTRLDISSFSFGVCGWGNKVYGNTNPNPQEFVAEVDMRPDMDLVVRIVGDVNETNGVVRWHFSSLDPLTMVATDDPLLGFLPPNDSTGRGQGYVTFGIDPLSSLQTGDTIMNCASIVFDYNAAIQTNCKQNIIDLISPFSAVAVLAPIQYEDSFMVSWQGSDNLSGISDYAVFVSTNGGAYEQWLIDYSDTSAYFHGVADSTYSFYSLATDSAGNVEEAPSTYDATTLVLIISNGVGPTVTADRDIAIIPNPNDGTFTLQLYSSFAARSSIIVSDMFGHLVFTGSLSLQRGVNSHRMELPGLGAGMYSIRVCDQELDRTTRFVKD